MGKISWEYTDGILKFIMEVKINQTEYDTFNKYVYPNIKREAIVIDHYTHNKYRIVIPDDIKEEIIEICASKLMEIGLDVTYEPNNIGMILENLIDYFNK